MGKHIKSTVLTENLTLSECTDGFWLYDDTRGMNLSMKAKTPQDALVECITYYQNKLIDVENKYNNMAKKVNTFVGQFVDDDDDY